MSYQPDFDVDKARGEEAEQLWRKTRSWMAAGVAEVKRDDRAHSTGNVFVEYKCKRSDGWKPSGLATTKATTWVIYAEPVLIAMPTWVLKNIARNCRPAECVVGSHPTKGVLLPLDEVFSRAFALWHNTKVAA